MYYIEAQDREIGPYESPGEAFECLAMIGYPVDRLTAVSVLPGYMCLETSTEERVHITYREAA